MAIWVAHFVSAWLVKIEAKTKEEAEMMAKNIPSEDWYKSDSDIEIQPGLGDEEYEEPE